jgi:periplasmic mercuric ion binding protein
MHNLFIQHQNLFTMKTLSLFAAILLSIFSSNTSTAQTAKTETIKVWGNCRMCKTTIEKAAKKGGAKTANWNEDSKELKVTYAVNKTSSAKIQESIAKSGYDTQDFTAVQTAYDNLHSCCKYDRKSANASDVKACCTPGEKCNMDAADCRKMESCKGKTCCKS